jgi:hypothetical protein
MNKKMTDTELEQDLVLRELWRAKDALSAARGHSVDKLFADLREAEKSSGHRVVDLQEERKKPAKRMARAA